MKTDEQLYRHNENITYLLQRRLSFMLRYGMAYLFMLGCMVLTSLYFIKVPDTLEGKFTLSSSNPPKSMVAKVNGRILKKRIEDKAEVQQGQILLIIESVANADEITLLENQLVTLKQLLDSNRLDSLNMIGFEAWQQLGEIQQLYEQFKKSNNELCLALTNGQYTQEKQIIEKRLANLVLAYKNLIKQRPIYEREYAMSCEAWQADSILGKQKSITQTELRNTESSKLQRKLGLNNLEQNLLNNETALNDIQQQLLTLEKNIAQQKNLFIQSYSLLKASIADWKNKYFIMAPFGGEVSFNRNIYEGLQVQAGEPLLYIVPKGSNRIAEIFIQQQNFGKLNKGQRAILKFDAYPFEEFGVVKGFVANVSNTPQEEKTNEGVLNVFLVQIATDSNLTTSYHKTILPRFGLTGTAAIALDNKSLLEKLFLDRFKALFVYQ